MTAIVLVEIDEHSRLRIRQSSGVRVAFVDHRVDRYGAVLFGEADQMDAIVDSLRDKVLLTPTTDDPVRTAADTIRRVATGSVVVAEGPTQ